VAPATEPLITGVSLPRVPRPKVHDAALRLRLLECAGATLSTGGLAALSLRTLAAEVGTSTTAVYALFGGKRAQDRRDAALADPHFYEVMFGGALPADERWCAVAAPILRPVADVVQRAAARGVLRPDLDPATVSLALWATVHGLVSLHLRGLLPADAPAPATVVDVALRAVVAGWLATPAAAAAGEAS